MCCNYLFVGHMSMSIGYAVAETKLSLILCIKHLHEIEKRLLEIQIYGYINSKPKKLKKSMHKRRASV